MNRANQQLLFQATNQQLLGIRQSEVNYYQSINVAVGTQAALIGGFTYGVFTINQITYSNDYGAVYILADIYWVTSSITIAFSVHVILCTMLMQVLGPGLALNGPVGSMARATEGMRLEQKQIIVSFVLMMIMFALSTLLSCWVVMTVEGAIGCSISLIVASCYWYKYCERIYLRFYWDRDESAWNERNSFDDSNEKNPTDDIESASKQLDRTLDDVHKSRTTHRLLDRSHGVLQYFFGGTTATRQKSRQNSLHSERSDDTCNTAEGGDRVGTLVKMNSVNSVHSVNSDYAHSEASSDLGSAYSHGHGPAMGKVPTAWAITSAKRGIVMEGYLTKRGGSTGKKMLDFGTEPWVRLYFTLTNTSNLFIYKNRNDYRTDAKAPVYTRPLRLQDYYVEVHNMNDPEPAPSKVLEKMEEGGANPYRFQMTLVLRENVHNPHFVGDGTEQGSIVVLGRTTSNPVHSGESTPVTPGSTASALSVLSAAAAANKQQMYRDHWVLRCDTEEELQQWVGIMRELCPSCFNCFGE